MSENANATAAPGMINGTSVDTNAANAANTGWHFAKQRFGAFIFVVAGSVAVILLILICIREFYRKKYGVDVFPGYRLRRRRDEQMDADRAMAEELQRRLNEEEREAERLAKRKERQAWYENFIKDFMMTATSEDLFYAHESNVPNVGKMVETAPSLQDAKPRVWKHMESSSSSISDEEEAEELNDIEIGVEKPMPSEPVVCNNETEEDAHLYLRLPIMGKNGTCRTVDAHCAICFSEYEAGDKVVWSGLQCQHAFHGECILPWLSKGKKRCPVCRHWFVPGARIEDQMKELEQRSRSNSEVGGESETTDETEDSHSRSEGLERAAVDIESGDSGAIPAQQDPLTTVAPGLEIESEVSDKEDVTDCLEIAEASIDHHKNQPSGEFGSEIEELTNEADALGAVETV